MTTDPAAETAADTGIAAVFAAVFGGSPDGVWAAPGRINLIGEHTDYNEGFVLPAALPHTTRVAARRRADGVVRLFSAQGDGSVAEFAAAALAPGSVPGWAAYPAGVFWALSEAGHRVGGADLAFVSDVPTGAGLSSSAALECATAIALDDLYGLGLDAPGRALLAQRAENGYVGVPCGALDQLASSCCVAGHAYFLDTRTLDGRQVPLDLAAVGLSLLVVDTRVKHDLADGAYAGLRAGCERAAGLLGVRALRDVGAAELAAAEEKLPVELRPLLRHVVTEDQRVLDAIALLDAGEPRALGPVLTAGHASLRDDYRVSCPETDLVVSAANAAGALGARMMGGGFGGSVLVLADTDRLAGIERAVRGAFAAAGFADPQVFPAVPSQGAHRVA
ncbi:MULTISPECIES: galactokinase [Kitasatospora]|uniref:Galactokinase n=1 Tax=Kitasatospora setae (strain ATCC 33774 / DSM 43861 / JCM 3304 / KCC A-0304 / NBRC 14216 / KM-6054) TaxID=452652 RepID=E4N121_KITSK|nr:MULTISPECIES: galactokinase [Kitasatospora]BAJ31855.1 putative galactokinase [Kitasatospora setae KM-6054]